MAHSLWSEKNNGGTLKSILTNKIELDAPGGAWLTRAETLFFTQPSIYTRRNGNLFAAQVRKDNSTSVFAVVYYG